MGQTRFIHTLSAGALLASAAMGGAVLLPTTALAQSGILEEVVVTAQRREESAQDVGIAISAFTGNQLEALGVEQSFDVANFTPGVHISGALAGQNTQFTIRGVSQIDFADIAESPNAVYLDEGYLAVAQAQTFAVFDIDRVEILKGPQGTLFGRNATGGLVHYISRKPTFDGLDGYLDLTYGGFDSDANADQITVAGAVGGPMSDTLAGRLAFRYNKQDGYLNNQFRDGVGLPPAGSPGSTPLTTPGAGADLGDDDTFSGRGTLLFEPNDNLSISFSGNYSTTEVATGPYQSKPTSAVFNADGELINVIDTPAGDTRASIVEGTGADFGADIFQGAGPFTPLTRPTPGGDFFGYLDPDGDDFNTSSDFAFANQGQTDTWGLNANVSFAINDNVTFTSVTDFKDYEKLLFIDVDGAPVNQLANFAAVDAQSFTQEFRLNGNTDRSRWTAGLFYLYVDSEADNALIAPENSITAVAFGGAPLDIGVSSALETKSYSVFGQYEIDLNDSLTLTTGLRVILEEKDYGVDLGIAISPGNFGFSDDFIPALGVVNVEDDTSDTLWTGKIQLDWHAGENTLVYGGINRGVKAGSFNAPLLGAFFGSGATFEEQVAALSYDEEILLSYEIGFKHTFNDGKTRLNGSAYYYDYQDYQAFLFVGVGGVVINADAENFGIELDLQTQLAPGLDAIVSMSWLDATVKDVPLRAGTPIPPSDVSATYSPEFQASTILRYEWQGLGGTLNVRGDVSYSDGFFYNLRNFDADKFDSYVLVNAGAGWLSGDENWEVDLSIKNLTDERAGLQGFDLATLCGCNEVSFRAPRWYGLSIRRNL